MNFLPTVATGEARISGVYVTGAQIQKDLEILNTDRLAVKLNDSAKSIELDSYQAGALESRDITGYPADQIADISEVNREMKQFRARINAMAQGQ